MSRTVVLAEKPSVGREIARVLGCHNKDNGYLYNHKYIVTWALGHWLRLLCPNNTLINGKNGNLRLYQ